MVREALKTVFEAKTWAGRGNAPRSGHGSSLAATERLRAALPGVFDRYEVKTFLDAPCGDWTWMQAVDLGGIDYMGADIAESLIRANRSAYARPGVRFEVLDVTQSPLPAADILMCRECLFHLKFWLRWAFFENVAASRIPYLMTSICHVDENRNVKANGGFQWFNPCAAPFNLPEPLETIPENYDSLPATGDRKKYRSMGVWSRAQIQEALDRRAGES